MQASPGSCQSQRGGSPWTGRPRDPRIKLTDLLVSIVILVSGLIVGLVSPQDLNFDQRNYHLFSGWRVLEGRAFDTDFAPVQVQSWINPLIHVPSYMLISGCSPRLAGALLGVLTSVSVVFLYFLSRLVLVYSVKSSVFLSIVVSVVGFASPVFFSQIATTFVDNILAALVIGALILVLIAHRESGRRRNSLFLASGLLIGGAFGLKLTIGAYVVGLSVPLLVVSIRTKTQLISSLHYVVGGMIGALAMGGAWHMTVYLRHGNPVYPFLSGFSGLKLHVFDPRPLPTSVVDVLTYPFRIFISGGGHVGAEKAFREPKFAILIALGAITALESLWTRIARRHKAKKQSRLVKPFDVYLLIWFWSFSYIIWYTVFGWQRFASSLELLSVLLILILLDRISPNRNATIAVFVTLAVFALAWGKPPAWGSWTFEESWYRVEIKDDLLRRGVLVVDVNSNSPDGYIFPHLSSRNTYVRLTGNHLGLLRLDASLLEQARNVIEQCTDQAIAIADRETLQSETVRQLLRFFDLEPVNETLRPAVVTRLDEIWAVDLMKSRSRVETDQISSSSPDSGLRDSTCHDHMEREEH